MRIKITDRKYEILVRAFDYAHDNTRDNSFDLDCWLLKLKLSKAKSYSESNNTLRGVLRRKSSR
jgi:hypothetical protein